jgi:tetratricopeptide (TPR) repeat protein
MVKLLQCVAGLAIAFLLGITAPAVAQRGSGAALFAKVTQLYQAGNYSEASPLAERLVATAEREGGPNHPNVATALIVLAAIYEAQARYADAEQAYKRALAIYEKANGPEHPQVADALARLARLHVSEGRYNDAEPLAQRSLAIR